MQCTDAYVYLYIHHTQSPFRHERKHITQPLLEDRLKYCQRTPRLMHVTEQKQLFSFTLNIHHPLSSVCVSVCVCMIIFIAVSRRLPLILDVSPDGIDSFKSR